MIYDQKKLIEEIKKALKDKIDDIKEIKSKGVNSLALIGVKKNNNEPVFIKAFLTRNLNRRTREIEAYKKIDNKYVVKMQDYFSLKYDDEEIPVGIFDKIEGKDLSEIINSHESKNWNDNQLLDLIEKIVLGLKAIWEAPLIHRDIKPDNIKIKSNGDPVILDLGLAKHLDKEAITDPGSRPGTDLYNSPEQIQGEVLNERSDQFSLGITLYEFVTGTHPFENGKYDILNTLQDDIKNFRKDLNNSIILLINKLL